MSERDEPDVAAQALQRMRRVPVLSEFAAPFPRLVDDAEGSLDRCFERLGEHVSPVDESVCVHFRVSAGEGEASYFVEAGPKGCQVSDHAPRGPDVEVILDKETWGLMATGAVSPLEAFGRGGMRVRGDILQARRFVRALHGDAEGV